MIPEKAVQAAHAAICEQNLDDCLDPDWRGKCVKAVEAAAPYMAWVTSEAPDALPVETVIRDSSGRVLDRWIETDEDL